MLVLNILATLEDALGESASRCLPRLALAFVICSLTYALSLVHTTSAGRWTLELVHVFLDQLTPWTLLTLEIIAVAWIYCEFQKPSIIPGAVMLGKDVKTLVGPACCWCSGFAVILLLYVSPAAPLVGSHL